MLYPQAQKFEMRESPRWCMGSLVPGVVLVLGVVLGVVLVGVGAGAGTARRAGAECVKVSIGATGGIVIGVSAGGVGW